MIRAVKAIKDKLKLKMKIETHEKFSNTSKK